MTKVLILGGAGMLGHKAYQILSQEFETFATFRSFNERVRNIKIFDEKEIFDNVDALKFDSVEITLNKIKPDVVLNCIGIIKQLKESQKPGLSIYINSLFPHLLARHCDNINSKLIHISTDCVFSGKKGDYFEKDFSDADDLYGRTKYLGEINYGNTLTLRTSIIGHELFTNYSLLEWFLSQEGKSVRGYVNAIYTGFPAVVLCKELVRIIKRHHTLKGLYNISSDKICKYELLNLVKEIYKCNIEIIPETDFQCDRSLNSDIYRNTTGFKPQSWGEMIKEMYGDNLKTNYQ